MEPTASTQIEYDEIDLRELFKTFMKRKHEFLLIVVILLVAGSLYTLLAPKTYESILFVKIGWVPHLSNSSVEPIDTPASLVALFKNQSIINSFQGRFSSTDAEPLAASDISTREVGTLFEVRAKGATAVEAQQKAQQAGSLIVSYHKMKLKNTPANAQRVALEKELQETEHELAQLQKKKTANRDERMALVAEYTNLRSIRAGYVTTLHMFDSSQSTAIEIGASLPKTPTHPKRMLTLTVSLLLGMFLGFVVIFVKETLQR